MIYSKRQIQSDEHIIALSDYVLKTRHLGEIRTLQH